MMMELKWLEDFLVLSKAGNFRIAAQQRCVSQPAFSRRIQALEAWMEAPLIDRASQPSQLTKAGKLFRPVAQAIVDLAKAGKKDVQTQVLDDKEKMRFSTLSSLAQIFLPAWLKSLQPLIDASQFVVKTDYDTIADYFNALEDNSVDLFVCYEDPKFRFQGNETPFISLKLGEESLVAVISPNEDGTPRYWLPDGPKGAIPCLHTFSGGSPSPICHHMENKYGNLNFKSVYNSSISPTLKAMALEGFGLAWIPSAHIVDDLKSGRLVRATGPKDDILVDIKIYRCSKYNETRVDKFWKVLQQQKICPSAALKTRVD
jgi:DNA-binding transcriptional LysR family regulator